MQIGDPISNPKLIIEQIKTEALQKIHAGSTVRATVIQPPREGVAQLNIEGQKVLAKTDLKLAAGESITVNVVKSGKQLELALVKTPTLESVKASAFRTLMPKQAPIQQLINTLRVITGAPVANSSTPLSNVLPQTVNTAPLIPQWSGVNQQTSQLLLQILSQVGINIPAQPTSPIDPKQPVMATPQAVTTGPVEIKNLAAMIAASIQNSQKPNTTPGTQSTPIPTPLNQGIERALNQLITQQRSDQSLPQPTPTSVKGMELPAKTAEWLASMFTASAKASAPQLPAAQLSAAASTEKQLAQQITALLNQGGDNRQPVTPERLKQALNQSGLLLEAQLAQGQPVSVDMKSSLLRLLFLLKPLASADQPKAAMDQSSAATQQQPAPPTTAASLFTRLAAELLAQTDGALARLQLNQLASLPQDEVQRQVWQFELPITQAGGGDSIGIQIQREGESTDQTEGAAWSAHLKFNIEPAGPISAQLILVGKEISSHFLAARSESAKTIERLLPDLSKAFIAAGLEVGRITARQGDIEQKPTDYQPGFPILDEHA